MKFKKGDWVTVIKAWGKKKEDIDYWAKYIGKTFLILDSKVLENGNKLYYTDDKDIIFLQEELRPATKEEAEKARQELVMKKLLVN